MTALWALEAVGDLLKAASASPSSAHGESAETWAEPIEAAFVQAGRAARTDASRDLTYITINALQPTRISAQRAELRLLIHQHYTARMTPAQQAVFWSVPQGVARRWKELGVLGPTTPAKPLKNTLDDMAEAARLTDLLHRHISYTEMRQLAMRVPQDSVEKLALHIANETLATAIEKMAARHGDGISDLAANDQRKYFLRVVTNLGGGGRAKNSRLRLAKEMSRLLNGQDYGREWERAAVTTTRYAYNLGVLTRLIHQGVEWIAFSVHPDACEHCKQLLLFPDGAVRVFRLNDFWRSITEDGGMNIGRKASLIGQAGGWRATVIQHPWCRCSPRRAKRAEIERAMQTKGQDDVQA